MNSTDKEFEALAAVIASMNTLDETERARVLAYVNARYGAMAQIRLRSLTDASQR